MSKSVWDEVVARILKPTKKRKKKRKRLDKKKP